ncbi:hypothetical protein [Aquibacillus saliphilus]|uniref:hypothetical protein n=1 Tax=Aquibacillus saliphilus TaxID=1909422 RepID=UPI001CEFE71A|nr:hypothetical protein [Aquibacillus saliphilus]
MKTTRIISTIFLIVLLIGCNSNKTIPEGFYSYDQEEVKTAVETLTFQPELPQFVPIKVEFQVSDHYTVTDTNSEALDVSFYTIENDLLSIQFVNGNLNEIAVDPEKVEINDTIEGEYVDNSYAKTLYWESAGVSYKMTYRASTVIENNNPENNKNVTKEEMVKVAKSFHL